MVKQMDIVVRTSSVAVRGIKDFENQYLNISVSPDDTMLDFRMALFNLLHSAIDIAEEEYSTEVAMNIVGEDAVQTRKKIGTLGKKSNSMLVSVFVSKFDKEARDLGCSKFHIQMPLNTRLEGGGISVL